ncbi:CTP synthetase [Haloplanus rubicundus]|uniref:CTP synthetase n=1 Tax=Haloplanus rubicundus TaxID=1547898 RepID=A0A345DYP0_9EURY|nr:CTP synthetase [Haloplanus rubicundus]AXG05062.1 CTP synthetase [Haloplanus rubicundus]
MTRAILAGPDRDGLGTALEVQGIDVTRVEGVLTAPVLDDAGVADADLFVLTDLDEATAISVVKDRNPDVRVVVYSHDSLPNFARGQTDLAMDPDLFGVDMVAEELA